MQGTPASSTQSTSESSGTGPSQSPSKQLLRTAGSPNAQQLNAVRMAKEEHARALQRAQSVSQSRKLPWSPYRGNLAGIQDQVTGGYLPKAAVSPLIAGAYGGSTFSSPSSMSAMEAVAAVEDFTPNIKEPAEEPMSSSGKRVR